MNTGSINSVTVRHTLIQNHLNKSAKTANTMANGALPPVMLDLSSGTASANNISKALQLSTLV